LPGSAPVEEGYIKPSNQLPAYFNVVLRGTGLNTLAYLVVGFILTTL